MVATDGGSAIVDRLLSILLVGVSILLAHSKNAATRSISLILRQFKKKIAVGLIDS